MAALAAKLARHRAGLRRTSPAAWRPLSSSGATHPTRHLSSTACAAVQVQGSASSATQPSAAHMGLAGMAGARAVVAFGGNALLKRGEPLTAEVQRRNAEVAAAVVAQLVQAGLQVCVTHGNGPQVGLLALQDPNAALDVLDAETEGQIGYLLGLELANALDGGPSARQVVALLTQVEVDEKDPAFGLPTKQIGPHYTKQEAERLAREKGWVVAPDGDAFRRVVPSPAPVAIAEAPSIRLLLESGALPVCCGGGGIPVAWDAGRTRRHGVEAVIDKDAASALLAGQIGADWLLMLTDADAIYDPERWPRVKAPLKSPITASELEALHFEAGSMAPKVAAAVSFVRARGGRAAVGHIADALDILAGRKGTLVVPGG